MICVRIPLLGIIIIMKAVAKAVVAPVAEAAALARDHGAAVADADAAAHQGLERQPAVETARVGQALDTVGAAGKNPKRITGFQTHDTPILLQYRDRAELANDQFVSVASVLEGFAILRPNPESEELKRKRKRELKALKEKEEAASADAKAEQ